MSKFSMQGPKIDRPMEFKPPTLEEQVARLTERLAEAEARIEALMNHTHGLHLGWMLPPWQLAPGSGIGERTLIAHTGQIEFANRTGKPDL